MANISTLPAILYIIGAIFLAVGMFLMSVIVGTIVTGVLFIITSVILSFEIEQITEIDEERTDD